MTWEEAEGLLDREAPASSRRLSRSEVRLWRQQYADRAYHHLRYLGGSERRRWDVYRAMRAADYSFREIMRAAALASPYGVQLADDGTPAPADMIEALKREGLWLS